MDEIANSCNGLDQDENINFYNDRWRHLPDQMGWNQFNRLLQVLEGMLFVWGKLKKPTFEICDLGCGRGWLTSELSKFGKVLGIDYSPEGIKIARQNYPDVTFEACDVLTYRSDKKFDVIVSCEVIEHVNDHHAYLETVDHHLRPGGFLILTCPNYAVKKYHHYPDQPIENQLTANQLRRLIDLHFNIYYMNSFFLNYSNEGPLRIVNSAKLRTVLTKIGLIRAFDALYCRLNLGLHFVICAQKPL